MLYKITKHQILQQCKNEKCDMHTSDERNQQELHPDNWLSVRRLALIGSTPKAVGSTGQKPYLEPCQTSEMERFAKIVNSF